MKDIWSTMSCDKASFEEFKNNFEKLFGKKYDENLATELINYYSDNPDIDLIKDKTFRKKLTDFLGVDIITNRKLKLNIESACSKIGDIMIMIAGMNAIENTDLITDFSRDSYNYLKALGLSGKALSTATAMSSSALTAATYTITERTINNTITGQTFDSDAVLTVLEQTVYSAEFGAFAGALHTLAISPLTEARPVQNAIKKIEQTLKSGELTGQEIMQMFYETQAPVIKSGIGQYAYSLAVNTAGAISFNIATDIVSNGLEPFKNENTLKYLGDVALENLKLILTFEGVRMILQMQLAGKQGASAAHDISMEEALKNMDLMKEISFKSTTTPDGKTNYTVTTKNGTMKFNSVSEVIALCCNVMQQEISLNNFTQIHIDDESNTSELSMEPEKTILTSNEENPQTQKVKTKSGPTEKPTYYKILSEQLTHVEQNLSSQTLPLKNKLSPFDDAIRTADLNNSAIQNVMLRNLCESFPSLQRNPYSITCLRQLQSLINSPEYQDLDEYQRETAKLIMLMNTEMINPDDIAEDAHISDDEKQRLASIETILTENNLSEEDLLKAVSYIQNINDFEIIKTIAKNKGIDTERIDEIMAIYSRPYTE